MVKVKVFMPHGVVMDIGVKEIVLVFPKKKEIFLDDLYQQLIRCISDKTAKDYCAVRTALQQCHFFVNGQSRDPRLPLRDGDLIAFLDFISGG
jgi:hypothetical protein